MGLGIKTKKLIQNAVDGQEEFRRGNVSGIRIKGVNDHIGFGRLPEEWVKILRNDHMVRFVILSYHTPIAWLSGDSEWVIPPVGYSQSTTGHVNVVRVAVGNYGFYNKM